MQKIKKSTSYANVAAPGGAAIVVLIQHYSKIEIKWNKQILPRFYVLFWPISQKLSPLYRKGVWGIGNTRVQKRKDFHLSFFVPPQGVAFIASGGIVAGIFVSNSPLTDTVFWLIFCLERAEARTHQLTLVWCVFLSIFVYKGTINNSIKHLPDTPRTKQLGRGAITL